MGLLILLFGLFMLALVVRTIVLTVPASPRSRVIHGIFGVLLAYGCLGFFGQAAAATGGLAFLPSSFEWPPLWLETIATDPPLRRVRQLRGYGALAVAAAFAASFVWAPLPASAGITGVIVVGLIVLFGGVQLWLARKTPIEVRVDWQLGDPNRLPVPERVRYLRRQLLLCSIAFPVASALVAYELNRFETGVITTVRLWFPVGFMYERFGYWPAVLVMPTLGAVLYWGLAFKLKQLEQINDSDA